MHLKLTLLFIALWLTSCTTGNEQKTDPPQSSEDSLVMPESTHFDRFPSTDIDPEFTLDTVTDFDTTFNVNSEIVVPLHPHPETRLAEELLRDRLQSRLDEFVQSIREDRELYPPGHDAGIHNFWAGATDAHHVGDYLSYRIYVDYFHAGAAHGMQEYDSFCYDLKLERQLRLADVARIETARDTATWIRLINTHFPEETGGMLSVENMRELDFSFSKDVFSINFDAYEIGPYSAGTPRSDIPMDSVRKLLRIDL